MVRGVAVYDEEDVEQAMVRLAGSAPIRLHVDLGTGTGAVLRRFASRAQQSVGIDSSRDMLAIARVSLEAAGVRHAQVRHGEIYALPFPDGFADFVTIHQVLHFLEDPVRALTEAARILAPGDVIIVPAGVPHWFKVVNGPLEYYVVKVRAEAAPVPAGGQR